MFDIVDFSILDISVQRDTSRTLWKIIDDKLANDQDVKWNGTGDGAIITWSNLRYTETVGFTTDTIAKLKERKIPARAAIHLGTSVFTIFPPLGEDVDQVLGRGPNDASRLVSLGDAGSVIVSDEFAKAWADHSSSESNGKLLPPIGQDPIQVFVKEGLLQQVRVLRKSRSRQQMTKPLKRLEVVKSHLITALGSIEAYLVNEVIARCDGLSADSIDARISILAPRPSKPVLLESTEFRYHRQRTRTAQGNTVYGCRTKGSAQGPPGRAFAEGRIQVVNGLADFNEDPESYVDQLHSEWKVPKKISRKFGRHARTFLSIPLGLAEFEDGSVETDAVLCCDLMNDLPLIDRDQLLDLANSISDRFGVGVAAMWRLRLQT